MLHPCAGAASQDKLRALAGGHPLTEVRKKALKQALADAKDCVELAKVLDEARRSLQGELLCNTARMHRRQQACSHLIVGGKATPHSKP